MTLRSDDIDRRLSTMMFRAFDRSSMMMTRTKWAVPQAARPGELLEANTAGFISLYHWASNDSAEAINKSRTLLANAPSDVYKCQFLAGRHPIKHSEPCNHDHPAVPNVLWLTSEPTAIPGSGPRNFRFTVRVPIVSVYRWPEWARKHGADPDWVKEKVLLEGENEWVTPNPIPMSLVTQVMRIPGD